MRGPWLGRSAYLVAITVVTAGLVHIVAVLTTPWRSGGRDSYAAISALAGGASLKTVALPSAPARPFEDPAMTAAACLFDDAAGPMSVTLDTTDIDFATLSVRGRQGRLIAGVTSRSASHGLLTLSLVQTAPPRGGTPVSDIRVETGEPTGFVLVQVLANTPSLRAAAEGVARSLTCRATPP